MSRLDELKKRLEELEKRSHLKGRVVDKNGVYDYRYHDLNISFILDEKTGTYYLFRCYASMDSSTLYNFSLICLTLTEIRREEEFINYSQSAMDNLLEKLRGAQERTEKEQDRFSRFVIYFNRKEGLRYNIDKDHNWITFYKVIEDSNNDLEIRIVYKDGKFSLAEVNNYRIEFEEYIKGVVKLINELNEVLE